MEILYVVGIVLAAIGAVNWGLVGLFKFDLVAFVSGGMPFGQLNGLSRLVYVLVALAGGAAFAAIPSVL